MIIVGFTHKTSKILPRIFCRKFRHCAPILIDADGKMTLHQFIRYNNIAQIPITMRDLRLLRTHGWIFICIPHTAHHIFNTHHVLTCVDFTCQIIGIRRPRPITPYGLYKKLKQCGNV